MKFCKLYAFTMAEAILVMVILGIIATIMISNMKPTEFRDRSLRVQAKKIFGQIDNSVTRLLDEYTESGKLTSIRDPWVGGGHYESAVGSSGGFSLFGEILEKKYFVTKRNQDLDIHTATKMEEINVPTFFSNCVRKASTNSNAYTFRLKDGTFICMGQKDEIFSGVSVPTIFPTETTSCTTSSAKGYIIYDVTGELEPPNVVGKDIWVIPIHENGIAYDATCD